MLTAAQAREITDKVGEKDLVEENAKMKVQAILVGIKKDASAGYCERFLDLDNYPKEVCKRVIQMLEDLGYKVKKRQELINFLCGLNEYIISW